MKKIAELVANREVYFVRTGQTVQEAANYMGSRNVGAVVVLEADRLAGIFSERDLMKRVVMRGLDPAKTKIEEVMTREVVSADADETYENCLRKMKQLNVRHLPIVRAGELLGLVSLRDLLMVDLDEKDHELKMMTAYIHYVPPK
ncbi:MAG: CBS domain-containing protein [Acidobacteriia bacterium]|nr:CBS domain-containing protein [Terriglobia bacterium]